MSAPDDPFSTEPWHVQSLERWEFWCEACDNSRPVTVLARSIGNWATADVVCKGCSLILATIRQERTA